MYFTREALEQSTAETVARHRARRFAGFGSIADLCCGIGGDALALAAVAPVVAVDLDPLRLAMARQNVVAYEAGDRATFREADLTRMLPDAPAAFFDPSRRSEGRRTISLRDCHPPLDLVRSWLPRIPAIAAKVAPAVPWAELAAYSAEVEFVSLEGELKECVLWFGPLHTANRRATLLPGGHTLAAEAPVPSAPPVMPRAYLYDPDPAVVRSGLVANLGEQLGARPISPDIAFLTADTLRPTPLATAYAIEESLPFQVKKLRQRLRELRVGRVTVVKRGSPLDVMELQWQLKLDGPEARVLVLTKVLGRPFVLIARREASPA
jgi:hypothetical protein